MKSYEELISEAERLLSVASNSIAGQPTEDAMCLRAIAESYMDLIRVMVMVDEAAKEKGHTYTFSDPFLSAERD